MCFINHTHKICFIANARTSSTSCYLNLENNINKNDDYISNINEPPNKYHMSVKNIFNKYPIIKNYYKFCFVRNPYTRFISSWLEFKNKGHSWASELFEYNTFKDFCLNFSNTEISKDIHFLPLYKQITIDNIIYVDYIAKFENIEEEYKFLSNKLNYKFDINVRERPTNISSQFDEYYDKETKNIIYNFYKTDFEIFNYDK